MTMFKSKSGVMSFSFSCNGFVCNPKWEYSEYTPKPVVATTDGTSCIWVYVSKHTTMVICGFRHYQRRLNGTILIPAQTNCLAICPTPHWPVSQEEIPILSCNEIKISYNLTGDCFYQTEAEFIAAGYRPIISKR